MEDDDVRRKPHRNPLSGRKAEKKKSKSPHTQELSDKQRNPKAFAVSSAVRAERRFRRTEDKKRKKEHIPVVDRTPLEPPPILVAVVGPPKVGKSLLIKCLIKSYTRQPLTAIKGPVTIVSGKKRRITVIECNNDINCMVDIAKVADLVLLMIDASFGFEMEVFEFLNVCQVHGMPKIMGVLTHLDMLKHPKKAQKTKKILKHRFWKEVYPGAKLFYLSNMIHGQYLKNEIKNLARFIAVMKFRPLVWQTSHPYILADRLEDTTPPEHVQMHPKIDRTVCLYGYMRGIPMHENSFIHIPGCGDFGVSGLSFLPDPCPLPSQQKKRSIIEKERMIYAPFSGVGGIVHDKDAVYVELPTKSQKEPAQKSHTNELVETLMETKETVNEKLASSTVQLFSGGKTIVSEKFANENEGLVKNYKHEKVIDSQDGRERKKVIFDDEMNSNDESDDEGDFDEPTHQKKDDQLDEFGDIYQSNLSASDKLVRDRITKAIATLENDKWEDASGSESSDDEEPEERSAVGKNTSVPWNAEDGGSGGSDVDEEEEEDGDNISDDSDYDSELEDTDLKWKTNLAEKASHAFQEHQKTKADLWKLVYGNTNENDSRSNDSGDENDAIGGLFKVVNRDHENRRQAKDVGDELDCSKFSIGQLKNWDDPNVLQSIKDCFVTGKWGEEEDADTLLKLDDLSDQDEEVFGDFEDLETGEVFKAKDQKSVVEKGKEPTKEELLEKKKQLKAQFDKQYDNKEGEDESYFEELKMEASRQAELNKKQFEGLDDEVRVKIEGYRAGMYVRIKLENMPCELVDNFDPTYPLVIGGLQPGEQNVGYVKVRIKKHRWYNKILKTKDPLIISMGWRRFQTIAVYSKQEDNMRHRMLKYTPEHVTCMAHFWGPITRAGTGFLALLSAGIAEAEPGFRVVATGSVVDTDQSTVVTKKLKLTGEPLKIFKKTAFVKGMFNSSLEVAKFEGAKIKTVSGIRGQIKKPLHSPEGAFRATFEDKILLSDIVFCRTWYKVDVPKFYAPITSLLLPPDQKHAWKGMRTLGALKREKGLRNPEQPDSKYTDIVRPMKLRKPLVVPRALEKELPYKYKRKLKADEKYHMPFSKKLKTVVVRDEHEAQVSSLIKKLSVQYKRKKNKERREKLDRVAQMKKRKQQLELRKDKKHKEIKKSVYRSLSKMETKEEKARAQGKQRKGK